jgi:hypothetical protein
MNDEIQSVAVEGLKTAVNPYRWVAALVCIAVVVGAFFWYRHSLIEQGRAECEEAHRVAAEAAGKTQQGQNEQATKEVIVTETVTETKYRDRIQEVIRYVPQAGTVCPADSDFLRLFNDKG